MFRQGFGYVRGVVKRRDVSDLRRFIDSQLERAGFTKDWAGRNNEVIVASWRRVGDGRLCTFELNDWDPWGEGRLTASWADAPEAESWWATRVPMTVMQMTPGDVELAVGRGVAGATREVALGTDAPSWQGRVLELISWLRATS